MDLIDQLKRDEGVRPKPYTDARGKLTIGVGRNLTDVGLSDDEINLLLANDLVRIRSALASFSWYTNLNEPRKGAIENMAFNLGVHGLLRFPHMISALALQEWATAAVQCDDPNWHAEVGDRASRLAKQLLTGEWQ